MKIPSKDLDRIDFYLDIIQKCLVSRDDRKSDYSILRNYFLFGSSPDGDPAPFNKIFPHIDQLTSFIYSAETTRFSILLGASVDPVEEHKTQVLTHALNDEWLNSNGDQAFRQAVIWSLVYNTSFIKLVWNKGVHPFMIDPGSIGVLREDLAYTDRQEAIVQTYYITKSELFNRLYSHPNRESIVRQLSTMPPPDPNEIPDGVSRIITSQVNPNIYGNVDLNLSGMNRYKARVAEDTVEMHELWVWNDDTDDYQVVTFASPRVFIYDRPGESLFMKGELPFVQVCPNPQYDYYWGKSEVQDLIQLQELRNSRMNEILDLLAKQVSPPTALIGFSGIADEKNFALNRAGGLLANDMPNAKVERMAPQMPPDLFEVIHEIDNMFAEVSGITNILEGKGESGVRSQGHASQLARLGSSRAKQRALVIEDALEKVATLYLKMIQMYDDTHFTDTDGHKFIAEQFTKDYMVKVDAHSNSPIFTEDLKQLAFNLFKAQAIDKETLIDLVDPPMKQLIKEKLRKKEAMQPPPAPQAHGQHPVEKGKKPKEVG